MEVPTVTPTLEVCEGQGLKIFNADDSINQPNTLAIDSLGLHPRLGFGPG